MIKTKHGSRVNIIGVLSNFGNYQQFLVEFRETGHKTTMNRIYLTESKCSRKAKEAMTSRKKRGKPGPKIPVSETGVINPSICFYTKKQ